MNRKSHFAIATRRPVMILMIVMAVCVFGFVSYQKLSLTLMPDISYPTLTVRTEYPGTAPQEVETQVSQRLEQQLAILPHLINITSISKAEQSDIILEFSWGSDMNEATQAIREKLDRVRLPSDAKRPLILRYDPTLDPVMRIGLSGSYSLGELRLQAEEIVQRGLEGEEGVAAIKVKGGLEEEFQVLLDEDKLVSLNLDIQRIGTRLAQNNVNLPGGRLYEGKTRYVIRTLNEFKSIEEIRDIVIAQKNGVNIRMKDVATVVESHKEIEIITKVNGRESVEIEVYKEADANIVEVARRVENRIFGDADQQEYVASLDAQGKPVEPVIKEKADSNRARKEINIREAKKVRRHKEMTNFIGFKLPEGSSMQILTDQSVFIKQSIDEVKNNALLGGGIAVFVIFLFLRNVGHTAIIGITIPVSIIATFAPMNMAGVSLNIISLGGLALGVGMLVDNSIVVLESVFRCREEGDELVESAIRGASEVGGAVIASTLTTIAVFFPIVFVEGVASQVFGDMSLTVVFSLLASLLVSLYFIPMLASRRFDERGARHDKADLYFNTNFLSEPFSILTRSVGSEFQRIAKKRGLRKFFGYIYFCFGAPWIFVNFLVRIGLSLVGKVLAGILLLLFVLLGAVATGFTYLLKVLNPVLAVFDFCFQQLFNGYRRVLNLALRNKIGVVLFAFGSFALSLFYIFPLLGSELIPKVHQGEFNLEVKLPVGTRIEDTSEVIRRIENAVLENPHVARTAVSIGSDKSATSKSDEGEHTGQVTVVLVEGSNRIVEMDVMEKLRQVFSEIPDVAVEVSYPELFSVKNPIEVELYGHDLAMMKELSSKVLQRLQLIPGIVDLQSSVRKGNPEIQIVYNRQRLSQLGLDLKSVAELVRNKIQGRVPTEFRREDRQIDILVRLTEEDRFGIADLRQLVINPGGDVAIPLSSIAELRVREGPNEIRHIDQQRGAVVSAGVDGIDLSEAAILIQGALLEIDFPLGFDYEVKGQTEEMDRSLKSLLFALALALFLVYIVMASQFESLLHPFIILFSVPLAIIGVLVALFAFGQSLNILVFIGLIMLAGIVVNNAIVLVDYINTLRRQGKHKEEAVKIACQARLRPILMTTLTTVLGLLPMALGLGEGSEIRAPLAITVIAGLSSSTFLTLVVIPSIYLLVDYRQVEVETIESMPSDIQLES